MKEREIGDRENRLCTKGKEIFNMVSNIVGGAIGIAVLSLCIIFAVIHKNGYALASGIVYGVSMILMYTMASIYHGLRAESRGKKVFNILDCCSIFVLIAGMYTPFALCVLREYNVALGWTMFGIVWGLAAIGIVLNSIDINKYRKLLIILYLLITVCLLCRIDVIFTSKGLIDFVLFILGIIFSVSGNCIFFLKKDSKWINSIFYIIGILGTIIYSLWVLIYLI